MTNEIWSALTCQRFQKPLVAALQKMLAVLK